MSKPGAYTRADVVDTALRLLDQYGLADLSMRRLAAELDVQPSALYWHVPNKQTLLALVSDQIIERAAVVEPAAVAAAGDVADWKAKTLAEATSIRNALLAFRDGAEVVSSTLALGLGADAALERIRGGIDLVCEDAEVARVTAESILFLVLGQVWHEQQRMQADSLGVTAPAVAADPAEVARFAGEEAGVLHGRIDSFEFGVQLIRDGLEKKLTLSNGSR